MNPMTEPFSKKASPKRKCLADTCEFWDSCPFQHDRDACDADSYEKEYGSFDLDKILKGTERVEQK